MFNLLEVLKEVQYLKQYKKKIKEWNISKWMIDQIEGDFNPYIKKGFNRKSLDEALNTPFAYAQLYKLKDGLLIPAPTYDKTCAAAGLILKGHQSWGLPEIDIVINQTDGIKSVSSDTTNRGPILTMAKDNTINGIVLFYTFDAFHEGPIHEDVQNDKTPWSQKKEQLIWRGVPSDTIDNWGLCRYDETNWKNFQRGKLVDLSFKNPELINARFSDYSWHTFDNMKKFFNDINAMGDHLSKADQIQYKYQIYPDGNVSTYSGIQCRLYSGSILFKIESHHLQWFESGL